jgi:hypothetical protein
VHGAAGQREVSEQIGADLIRSRELRPFWPCFFLALLALLYALWRRRK